MKKIQVSFLAIVGILTPAIAFAQQNKDLKDLIKTIIGYFDIFLSLLIGIALIIFVWYVIQYFIRPNDKRSEAAMYVLYSIIGFFVILSFWGLVNILQNTFGLSNETYAPRNWSSFTNLFPGGGGGGSPVNDRPTYTDDELDLLRSPAEEPQQPIQRGNFRRDDSFI